MRLRDLTKGKINVINGPDETLLLGLTAGADGGIGTTYNFNYNAIRNIYNLFKAGKIEEARREQENVCRVISLFHKGYRTIPATRALLEYMGYDVGDATFPFVKYSKEKKEEIVKAALAEGWKPW